MEKVKVNQDICIGCGACMSIAPDVFEMNEEGLAVSKKGHNVLEKLEKEEQEDVMDALEGCPTGAIFKEEVETEEETTSENKKSD